MADNIIKVPINFDKEIAAAYKAELEALRAKLAEVERERDEYLDHCESAWLHMFDDSVKMNLADLPTHIMSLVRMLNQSKSDFDDVLIARLPGWKDD